MIPNEYSFTRYLTAKRSVDDRALNRRVWDRLGLELAARKEHTPLRILEIGCGIGTMVERLAEARLFPRAHYTALDVDPMNIHLACCRLAEWGRGNGMQVTETPAGLVLTGNGLEIHLDLLVADAFDFARREAGWREWDLLVAHAFLDLVDIPALLPMLFHLLKPGGLFYFTLNFDGVTALEPTVDPDFDRLVEQVYHRTMDERRVEGRLAGDSRSGSHLFAHLHAAGGQVLEAGGSDWLVYPGPEGYPGDETYFLHFIVETIFGALRNRPEVDPARLAGWTACRHAQVERRELVYLAHQVDFLGIKAATSDADRS